MWLLDIALLGFYTWSSLKNGGLAPELRLGCCPVTGIHQQPEVNYLPRFEKGDFP